MKLCEGNTYIIENKEHEAFTINIQMPDGSRNYIHSELYGRLETAIQDRTELTMKKFPITPKNITIAKEKKYYRIHVFFKLHLQQRKLLFHSRLLNLNDVTYERMQLLMDVD